MIFCFLGQVRFSFPKGLVFTIKEKEPYYSPLHWTLHAIVRHGLAEEHVKSSRKGMSERLPLCGLWANRSDIIFRH